MAAPNETDYVDAAWNKYRTFKDKIAHEAIKEYWQEIMQSELGIQDEKAIGVQHHLNALSATDEGYVSDNPIIRFRPY
jgi:hypothetical protein